MEKWSEICFLINRHIKANSNENNFQNEVENIFEKLGWSRFRNEIISNLKIPIGSVSIIEPDIIIKFDRENIFVVELKRPNIPTTQRQGEQLFSYMRQLKLNVGLLIGSSFQIYYDDPDDSETPIKVYETGFVENNEEAANVMKLFEKHSFDKYKLQAFCEEKLEEVNDNIIADEIITNLEEQGEKKLMNLLINNLKEDYNQNIIDNIANNLNIIVKRKTDKIFRPLLTENKVKYSNNTSKSFEKLPISFVPEDTTKFKELLLLRKEAIEEIHYTDGTINESIWKANEFKESSNLIGNVRSRPYARKGKWKELEIAEIVYRISE